MARIKIKYGENEVEIESKDFYVDNQSVTEVINNLSVYVKDYRIPQYTLSQEEPPPTACLDMLEEAEVHEPEFVKPSFLDKREIMNKIKVLAGNSFFDEPRTVSEVVSQLREYGWFAVPLDVSKVLTEMSFRNQLQKELREKRSYYSVARLLEVN